MEINCEEFGGSYAPWVSDYRKVEWGFGNLGDVFGEDDDFLNPMSFSVYQMPYETMNSVGSGNGSGSVTDHTTLFNDFVGFGGNDLVSILPEDPFCMNIRSTLNTISDWFHENHIGLMSESYDGSFGGFDQSMLQQQISSLGLKMNDTESFCQEVSLPEDPFCMQVSSTLNTMSNWFHENRKDFVAEQIGAVDQMLFESLSWFYNPTPISQQNHCSTDLDDDSGEPHDDFECAFELVLPYLQLKEILVVEGVCRSLRDLVRKDPFFWRTIDLNDSLVKHRVTDESLFKLTLRSHGNLQCLNLGGCVGITDYGLKQVLSSNPHLTKLSVSGCLRLSTAGLMSTLRDLKSSNRLGLKSLITGGVLYFTKDQFEELNLLLGADAKEGPTSRKQRLYISCRSEFSLEDAQVTDLEICPKCEKPSLVFDCPAKTCSLKVHLDPKSMCRGCVVCIERCHECGKCLNDSENKPFCFAFSCVICYKKSSNHLLDII